MQNVMPERKKKLKEGRIDTNKITKHKRYALIASAVELV